MTSYRVVSYPASAQGPDPDDPPPSPHSYSTNFDDDENPLSEGGAFSRADNAWTDVITVGGLAYGTNGPANTFDDSYALLSGFAPNQSAQATVVRHASLDTGIAHEVEILLRFTDSETHAGGYECLFGQGGDVAIICHHGPFGSHTSLGVTTVNNLGRALNTGDVVKGSIIGTLISAYINGVLMCFTTDSEHATGQPGPGFFTRPGGNSAHLALTNFSATDEV